MTTIAQLQTQLQDLFEERANALAKETGFVKRKRNLSGADFVQGQVFGLLANPDHSMEELARLLGRRDVQISASGLCQRFSREAVTLFQRLVEEAIALGIQAEEAVPSDLLKRFEAVILEDSTTISLPDKLADLWPGCGGGGKQTKAGVKWHVRLDLVKGGLQVALTPSRVADPSSPLLAQSLGKNTLHVTDEAYCSLQRLSKQEGRFLTRPSSRVQFLDPQTQEVLDLEKIGPLVVGQALDREVLVGKDAKLPGRLLLVRVPDEVVEQRRERIRSEAKRRGHAQANAQSLLRAQWTLLITNASREQLTVAEVVVLQRARWQIERLFRLWKSDGHLDEWKGRTREHIQCEMLARMLAMLVQQWLLVMGTWNDPFRSLVKAAKQVRVHALELLSALAGEAPFSRVMQRLMQAMKGCQVHRRTKHPSHAQLLMDGLDWPIFEEEPLCLT